jgi:glycosyltransferase involved in cell wall biosynthesis
VFRRRRPRDTLVILNWRDLKHPEAGGAEMVCERLARSFVAKGHEVVLLSSAVRGERRKERTDGYLIIRRGSRFTVYPWVLFWLLLHRSRIVGVIDSQNGIPFFSPAALRSKTPVLMLLHHIHQEQFSLYFSPAMAMLGRWLERYGSRLVYRDRSIVAVSPSTRARGRRTLGLKGEIVVVPPGTDAVISSLASRRRRAEHGSIVCVGRLVAHKRIRSIVEAIPPLLGEFPHMELHLVGDGPERSAIEALVESLGLGDHVVLHGFVSSSQRDQILHTAWMSVNASEGEGWGLSVVEANAAGVPVLAFRRPGLRDSIRDGETGWLIDESEDLSSAIGDALRQMSDEEAAVELGARARQWASQFTWDKMADQVLVLLAAEAGRLAQSPNNRRMTTDLATVVRMPIDLIPEGIVPTFRHTDVCEVGESDLVVLLRGTDTEAAMSALQRAGFSIRGIIDERLQISVARHIDLVSPAIPASTPSAAPDRLRKPLAG